MASEILHRPGDSADDDGDWPPPSLPSEIEDRRPPVWQTIAALALLVFAAACALAALAYALSVL